MPCCDLKCAIPRPMCARRGTDAGVPPLGPVNPAELACLPLFERIAPSALAELLAGCMVIGAPKRSLLFSAGDAADCFYVVLDGRVKLFALDIDGNETVVEVFEPVSSFAEAAMFASGSFPLSAEALDDARLARIPSGPFLRKLRQDRSLGFTMLANLSLWQRKLVREIGTLKHKTPSQRVGAFLLSLAEEEEGPATVSLPFRKSLVASRLGIEPESFSRVLRRFRAQGIEIQGSQVRIPDVAALRQACG